MMDFVRLLKLGMTVIAVITVVACSPTKKSSTVSIVLPGPSNNNKHKISRDVFNGVSIDYTKACFAVNVIASDISGKQVNCGPSVGIFSGFQASGTTVTLQVPMGVGRKFEIYYFSRNNSTDPCPQDFASSTPDKFSRIGTKSDVDTSQAETDVEISVFAPSVSDTLVSQLGLPAACTASASSGGHASHVVLGSVKSSSAGGYSISGQVTSSQTKNELVSTGGYTMYLGPKGH